jgi:hypothetical protein
VPFIAIPAALLIAVAAGQATQPTDQTQPQPPPAQTAPAPPSPPPLQPESEQFFRLRLGLGLNGGEFNPGSFIALGAAARLGFTLGELFALYGDVGYTGGIHVGSGLSGEALSFGHLGVLLEVTLFDDFFIAAGPVIASGKWTAISVGCTGNETVTAGSFAFPGIDLRAGLGFGSHADSGRRQQFTITADVKFLFATVSSVTGASSLQKVGDGVVGLAATIGLGWDAK